MKTICILLLFCTPCFLAAQITDDTAAPQVDSLVQLTRALIQQGQLDQAMATVTAAEKIALEKFGKESAAYGSCCHNHGYVLLMKSELAEAEGWYLEAIAIRGKVLGEAHPDYAGSQNHLGILYRYMAAYEKAEPCFLKALAIYEKTLGREHPAFAGTLNNLATLYWDMGAYEKVEPLYLESKAIRERVLGKEHPDYAGSLINLALLYSEIGDYSRAEQLYLEARDIFETKLKDRKHPFYKNCLNNLANLYHDMEAWEKAEQLRTEVKAIQKAAVGKKHPDYGFSLMNLANLYWVMGQYEKAEPLYLEAKAIYEKTLGKEHPVYASCVSNLANQYREVGAFEKSEPLFLEAKAVYAKTLGRDHYDYSLCLILLAAQYETLKRFNDSDLLLQDYFALTQKRLSQSTAFLSERDLASYSALSGQDGDQLLSWLLARQLKQDPAGTLPTLSYNHALFQKGFLLTAANRLNSLSSSTPESIDLFNTLKASRRRLAAELAKPLEEQADIARLKEQANADESALARAVAGYAENNRQVNWREVQAALKPQEAAIEFVHFQVMVPTPADSFMYAALVLVAGAEQPLFIPLFEERSLDSLLGLHQERRSDYVNDLYAFAERGAVAVGKPKKSLYELIWQPLEGALKDIKQVYYTPAGLLHRINLNAIPVDAETILGDRIHLVQLNSTRQLTVPGAVAGTVKEAVLFGGIQYEFDTTAILAARSTLNDGAIASRGGLEFSRGENAPRGGTWNYLKWTKTEVESIAPILESAGYYADTHTDYNASEEVFRSIGQQRPAPQVLHVATHGFFFPDPKEAPAKGSGTAGSEPAFKMSEHPMIRSGLLLAGGNLAWQNMKSPAGMEDGILTAYEISQMNLSTTELVVLSACETGLGDIEGNEGVYGLQRAFKIAGAKYLIMSLWQVPDRETKDFMVTFYRHWLEDGMAIPEAFEKTQQEMKERFYNPYQWAGFVLVE